MTRPAWPESLMRPFPAIISFSAVATSLAIGGWLGPVRQGAATARRYRDLAKPDLTPPPYVFATIWPILGLGLAFYGYRAMTDTQSHLKRTRITLWALLTAGILAFPLVAFQWRRLQVASGLAAAMALLALGGVTASCRRDIKATCALAPMVPWLGFATWLQFAIWQKNPDEG